MMLAVDGGWRRFEWEWVDNARQETTNPPSVNSSGVQAGEAELGNARMAYYTATGKAPFGMKSEDLLLWFSNHVAAAQAA